MRIDRKVNANLSIASVCRTLPTPDDSASGVFVMHRLAAMARKSRLRVFQPIPYFPIIRPLPRWACSEKHVVEGEDIHHAPMFYLPKYLKFMDSYWLYRSVIGKLKAMKAIGRLDVIDAHFAYPDGAGCVRAAQELRIPVVVTLRGVEEDQLQIPMIAKQIRAVLDTADGCICVSHSLKQTAVEAGADEVNTRVIHNAVNRSVFAPGGKSGARADLNVADSGPLIVSVGNLLSVKCHDVLISAFAKLHSTHMNARLAIIGGTMHEPECPSKLREHCQSLGIADRVIFVGRVNETEVAKWLRAADVFALASRREGCCNAVLEALASGLPVVATSVGDNPWFVKDGENGYLVPVGDSEAIAHALDEALGRKDWDRYRISSDLQVGDWGDVANDVNEFLEERASEGAKK